MSMVALVSAVTRDYRAMVRPSGVVAKYAHVSVIDDDTARVASDGPAGTHVDHHSGHVDRNDRRPNVTWRSPVCQSALIGAIVNDELSHKYPPTVSYRQSFWREYTNHICGLDGDHAVSPSLKSMFSEHAVFRGDAHVAEGPDTPCYRLYDMPSCPFANRGVAVLRLNHDHSHVGLTVVRASVRVS